MHSGEHGRGAKSTNNINFDNYNKAFGFGEKRPVSMCSKIMHFKK